MHNLAQLGTANLETMGGLITFADAVDLPESASPRCWDVDFPIGSVITRPGLSSVFSFTQVISITAVTFAYGVGNFTYASVNGSGDPLVNESFVLSGFTGPLFFLNGLQIVVESVNTLTKVFQALVSNAPVGTFTGLSGTATSTVGNFIGPNVGGEAVGLGWSSPTNILGNVGYASLSSGSSLPVSGVPTSAINYSFEAGTTPWTNVTNIITNGSNYATSALGANGSTEAAFCSLIGLNIPANASITGLSVSVQGNSTVAGSSLQVLLGTMGTMGNVTFIGTSSPQPLVMSPTFSILTFGSSTFLWGAFLTPAIVNASGFGVATVGSTTSACTIKANSVAVTVYYTVPESSVPLSVTVFAYSVPSTSGISGILGTFQAYTSSETEVNLQLLQAGVPVGEIKTVTLTPSVTVYSLGGSTDLWGIPWVYSDINNTQFGVQVTTSGTGVTFINDLDLTVFITPQLANFNYVKTYFQNDGQYLTLALDSNGVLWQENLNNNPGTLSVALTGIIPGSYARSATADDREYIVFSDLTIGTDRPRTYDGTNFFPLSQVGPGVSPAFSANASTSGNVLVLTAFEITSDVVTFTYTGVEPTPGQLYAITEVPSPYTYLNFTGTVLGTPAPTSAQFSMALTHADVPSTPLTAGIATLTYSYPIASITQAPSNPILIGATWTAGPGNSSPGTVLTLYYGNGPQDPALLAAINNGITVPYVYLSPIPGLPFSGTYVITGAGYGVPAGRDTVHNYFTVNVGVSGFGGTPGGYAGTATYQLTLATLTTSIAVPDVATGDSVEIIQATPSQWNNSWSILNTLKNGVYDITSSQLTASTGIATFGFSLVSGVNPAPGNLVQLQGLTNSPLFNTIGVVATVPGNGTFTVGGFASSADVPFAPESGQAFTFGTQFNIDPGALTLGTTTNPIYGNDSGTGLIILGTGATTPVGSGTRQGVVFFITESGYETAPSPPVTFTVSEEANYINVSGVPIGPPNVIARGIAITEAGQNGVPGANFYVIPEDVTITVGTTVTKYTSTIINDNTSTTAKLVFTDAVLLNSTEVDIQGNNLFNLIELGSSAWCVPYASRMFYGMQLNKVNNFNNLTFDGGYIPSSGGAIVPAGWNTTNVGGLVTLNNSTVTGQALYVQNNTGSVLANAGQIYQTAYEDPFNVAIIGINTTYSVRVAVRNPSGLQQGSLSISLTDFNVGIGFGTTYGQFTVPLTSMTTETAVFSGPLLTQAFTNTVSQNLSILVQGLNLGPGSDYEIDRIEVYPTLAPYLLTQVYGSYVDNLEAIDASGQGGIIDTSRENSQTCVGGFVMHDRLYLLKTASWYETEDNPNSEPGGWDLREVSNRAGACGINAYDSGEEWAMTACRSGIYGFNGGQPTKVNQEIWNMWDMINWDAGQSIVLRVDINAHRALIAVPLPVPNKWLPFEEPNAFPTTPNVMIMLNYTGMNTFEELVTQSQVHTTMFGTLASVDMKRKWTIWRIPSPYMDFCNRSTNANDLALLVCNGIESSKIYQFLDDQLSDDGVAINGLYTTYGFVNATKAVTMPIFGMHAKRYTVFQTTVNGAGNLTITAYPNTLAARYPYTIPGTIALTEDMQDDIFRPLNQRGQRLFFSYSTNAVGSWFQLHKILLSGKADPWSPIAPTGGGNAGFAV